MDFLAHFGRTALAFSILAAVPLTAAASASSAPATAPLPTVDGYEQVRRAVADGVWTLVQPKFWIQPAGNVTIIEQTDGFVLIDSGASPGMGRRVVEHVRALGKKPIKAVVLTHWHGDHPKGLAEIVKAFPNVRTISTAATKRYLQVPKMNGELPFAPDAAANAAMMAKVDKFIASTDETAAKTTDPTEKAHWRQTAAMLRHWKRDLDGSYIVLPKEEFTDRLLLDDPVRPVELLWLGRANTDGDAVAWLPRQKVVVTGDVVVAPIPFGFGSYPTEWTEVLQKIAALDFAVLVPGHGEPQRDRAYLNNLVSLMQQVRSQVGALAAQGLSLDEVKAKVDLSAQVKTFVGDDPWMARWFQSYWVTPITISAYKEARGEPWEQIRVIE